MKNMKNIVVNLILIQIAHQRPALALWTQSDRTSLMSRGTAVPHHTTRRFPSDQAGFLFLSSMPQFRRHHPIAFHLHTTVCMSRIVERFFLCWLGKGRRVACPVKHLLLQLQGSSLSVDRWKPRLLRVHCNVHMWFRPRKNLTYHAPVTCGVPFIFCSHTMHRKQEVRYSWGIYLSLSWLDGPR
jgi:hypothetical protein